MTKTLRDHPMAFLFGISLTLLWEEIQRKISDDRNLNLVHRLYLAYSEFTTDVFRIIFHLISRAKPSKILASFLASLLHSAMIFANIIILLSILYRTINDDHVVFYLPHRGGWLIFITLAIIVVLTFELYVTPKEILEERQSILGRIEAEAQASNHLASSFKAEGKLKQRTVIPIDKERFLRSLSSATISHVDAVDKSRKSIATRWEAHELGRRLDITGTDVEKIAPHSD